MPRYEAVNIDRKMHPFQIIFYAASIFYFLIALTQLISAPGNWVLINFMISLSLIIYVSGRIYGEMTLNRDFVEITSDGISFRSTPPLGLGWLPKSRNLPFENIMRVDIVKVVPFYDQTNEVTALLIRTNDNKQMYVANNLSEEQIIKIGLALKGSVAITGALSQFLGVSKEEVVDSLKDIGTKVFKSFFNSQKGNGPEDQS